MSDEIDLVRGKMPNGFDLVWAKMPNGIVSPR